MIHKSLFITQYEWFPHFIGFSEKLFIEIKTKMFNENEKFNGNIALQNIIVRLYS